MHADGFEDITIDLRHGLLCVYNKADYETVLKTYKVSDLYRFPDEIDDTDEAMVNNIKGYLNRSLRHLTELVDKLTTLRDHVEPLVFLNKKSVLDSHGLGYMTAFCFFLDHCMHAVKKEVMGDILVHVFNVGLKRDQFQEFLNDGYNEFCEHTEELIGTAGKFSKDAEFDKLLDVLVMSGYVKRLTGKKGYYYKIDKSSIIEFKRYRKALGNDDLFKVRLEKLITEIK